MSVFDWRVGGKRGKQLLGYAEPDNDEPAITITCGSAVWDFTITNVNGSGRVRVGNGCTYNPLHLVEAIYRFVSGSMDEPSLDGIQMSDDFKEWARSMGEDWS